MDLANALINHVLLAESPHKVFSFEIEGSSIVQNSLPYAENLKNLFRKYARIIHPDKCSNGHSHEAFVILKASYEHLQSNQEHFSQFDHNAPIPKDTSKNVRKRCYEDDEDAIKVKLEEDRLRYIIKRRAKKQINEELRSVEEDIESFLRSTDVESHSSEWKRFQTNQINSKLSGKGSRGALISVDNAIEECGQSSTVVRVVKSNLPSSQSLIFCYLCQRAFSSWSMLDKHNAGSALHAANLVKAKSEEEEKIHQSGTEAT